MIKKIDYVNHLYGGLSKKCSIYTKISVGSMSCQNCEFYESKTYAPVGKEMYFNGRRATIYGGYVNCKADYNKIGDKKSNK